MLSLKNAVLNRRGCMAAVLLGLLGLGLRSGPAWATGETLRVAAASDLRTVWLALVDEFAKQSDIQLSPSFAASGKLTQQIEQGAPFDVFLSADESFIERLRQKGLAVGQPVRYTRGQLGLWIRDDSSVQQLDQLSKRLSGKLVLANPRHAPYGMRAEEALRSTGQWEPLVDHLVLGENVAQAAQLVVEGQAEAALIAWSMHDEIPNGRWIPISPALHQPLWQVGVALKSERPDAAQRWLTFLRSPEAQAVFQARGFLPIDASQTPERE